MDMALEAIAIPVSNIDAAKTFYADGLGFIVDMDFSPEPDQRWVQLTPPGSACSIHLAAHGTRAEPGSLSGLILVVDSADAAKQELTARGVPTGEIEELSWGKHVAVTDPDGNTWVLQESFARNARRAEQNA